MPQRYPSWVIRNIVDYLKLKLSRQFPTFSCHNEKQEYEVQLTDNYPRLYIFASVAEPLAGNITCILGPNKNIELEVLIRDRRTSRLFIKFALKTYKDFDFVINCMHQSICNYLINDPHKLSCSSPYMQAWTSVWSPAQNIETEEKYISPDLYASYFERDGGYTINSDTKIRYNEKDDGSADYNNIQDPYLAIEQIPKPDNNGVVKLTDAEDKQRRANIVKAVEVIWEKMSKEKYPGAEKPTINNLLGGTLIAKKNPLRIMWVKYSFKKIHDYLISLGQQDSEEEMVAAKPSVSIHSSSAEYDATSYSRPRKAPRQLHAYPTYSHVAPKQETSKKRPDPFYLYMTPTPENADDAEEGKEELSVPAIKPLNKSDLLNKALKPSAPPAPQVQSSIISSPTLDERDAETPKRLTRSLSRKTSQSEIPHSLGDPHLQSSKKASDKADTTEQKSVAFSATTKSATPHTNPIQVMAKSPAPPIKITPLSSQLHSSPLIPAPVTALTPSLPIKAPPAISKQPPLQFKSSQAIATPPALKLKASPITVKQPVNAAKSSAPKSSPAPKEPAKPVIPKNDSDSLVARLAAKALTPPIIKRPPALKKPSAIKTQQTPAAQPTSTFDPAAYTPAKSVSFSNTLASIDDLLAKNKKRKQGAAGTNDATVEPQETVKSKPVATDSKATALAPKATLFSKVARESKNDAYTAKDLERGNPDDINLEKVTSRSSDKRTTTNHGTLDKKPKRKRDAPIDAATPESESSAKYPSRKR